MTCQRCKPDLSASLRLLQPLHMPSRVWDDIIMNLIERLPFSKGLQVIFVVADCLSKAGHFLALAHPYIVEDMD